MTVIENDSPKAHYRGPFNEGQLLPLTFPYTDKTHVFMLIDGTPAIYNVDYEIITEVSEEHPIAYPNSAYIKRDMADVSAIVIFRETPLDQQADFPQNSKFRSERIEQALDKICMEQQEQEEKLSRCIVAPITLETFNGQLPEPAPDTVLKWNEEGKELENYDIIGAENAFKEEVRESFATLENEIDNTIQTFETEVNQKIQNIHQDVQDFEADINEVLDEVLDAADQLENLDNAVASANNSAESATASATAAAESSSEAKYYADLAETTTLDAVEKVTSEKEVSLDEINTLTEQSVSEINSTTDAILDEINTSGAEIINRVSLSMFDTILKDHVLTYEETRGLALQGTYVYKTAIAGERYGYPDFINKCIEEYNEATVTETVNGVTVNIHSNGHKFYNIADKEAIDTFFNTMGSAWFYGIDTENERIFLPRNNYFDQMTDDITQVGDSIEAGLPNITGSANVGYLGGTSWGQIVTQTSGALKALSTSTTQGSYSTSISANQPTGLNLDASRSNPIYSNSDTVQPNAVKRLLYICVGNKITDTAHIDIVTQVNNGVKDLEDKKNECLVGIENNKDLVISELQIVAATEQAELEEIRDDVINYAGIYYEEILDDNLQIQVVDVDYVSDIELENALATKQDVGDYVTNTELNNKGYLTSYTETDPVYIADKPNIALKSELPDLTPLATKTEVNEGLNTKQDKGDYATRTELSEGLDTKQDKGNYALKSEIPNISNLATKDELPTQVSELENDSNYATQTQVLQAIASIPQFVISLVEALPETGEKMTLYLVSKGTESPDVYDEYIWIEATSSFEFLGTTAVDLTDYVKNTDYATTTKGGVFIPSSAYGITVSSAGYLSGLTQPLSAYDTRGNGLFICKGTLENVKNDLVKRAVTENDITLTDDEKTSARTWLGAVGSTEYAGDNAGVIKRSLTYGTSMYSGYLTAGVSSLEQYTTRQNSYFIGKGTLENVLTQYSKTVLTTEADYEALETKDANTLYLIEEE